MITSLATHSKTKVYSNKLASMLEGQFPLMRGDAEPCSHPAGVSAAAGAQSCPSHPCNSPYETDTPEIPSIQCLVYRVVAGKSAMSVNSRFHPPSLAMMTGPTGYITQELQRAHRASCIYVRAAPGLSHRERNKRGNKLGCLCYLEE